MFDQFSLFLYIIYSNWIFFFQNIKKIFYFDLFIKSKSYGYSYYIAYCPNTPENLKNYVKYGIIIVVHNNFDGGCFDMKSINWRKVAICLFISAFLVSLASNVTTIVRNNIEAQNPQIIRVEAIDGSRLVIYRKVNNLLPGEPGEPRHSTIWENADTHELSQLEDVNNVEITIPRL
jgi:hypothetical protein